MTLAGPPDRRVRRRRRWPVVLSALAVLIVVGLLVSSRVTVAYYSLTPGLAQPVLPLIRVPADRAHRSDGAILLTDVSVTRLSALGYVAALFDSDAQVVSADELLGPYTPPEQLAAQGYLEMAQSQAAAKAAAFTRLGYPVPERDGGALVAAVQPGSPASRALAVGQIVQEVGGTPTPDACALLQALTPYRAGQSVRLSVERSRVTPAAVVVPGPRAAVTVRLDRPPAGARSGPTGCPGLSAPPSGYLGVAVGTQQDYRYPFPVTIDTTDIGGPSAGLAMALGLVDKLGGGHLTGGLKVAATGTIAPDGSVGPVGGVPQKTLAVERAGATVFFVPQGQLSSARSKAGRALRVFAVSSLDQALNDLRHLGGQVPSMPQGTVRTP